MSLGLEFTGDYGPVQRNFDKLNTSVLDTGGQDIATRIGDGTDLVTFPGGSSKSGTTVVSHGLGVVPVFVAAVPNQTQGGTDTLAFETFTYTDTTFSVRGQFTQGLVPALGSTATFGWKAEG